MRIFRMSRNRTILRALEFCAMARMRHPSSILATICHAAALVFPAPTPVCKMSSGSSERARNSNWKSDIGASVVKSSGFPCGSYSHSGSIQRH